MLAARLLEPKSAIQVTEVATPTAGAGEVVVRLHAAALNRRDFWITQGLYPGVQVPVTLGSDGAGRVTAVGCEEDAAWLDQEVVLNPGLDWGAHQAHQAASFHILGMPTDGTLAEEVVIPTAQLHRKPAHLDWEQAAALPLAGVTAYRALFSQGGLQARQQVLVTGIGGGVATHALQFARAAGAEVSVTSSSEAKRDKAVALGAAHAFDYTSDTWVSAAKSACGGFDLIIDGAGGKGYAHLLALANPGGTIVNYGSTAGPPESLDLFKVFWKQLHLVGSTMGSPRDFASMLQLVSDHKLAPVIDATFPLAEAGAALAKMGETAQFGKLVLRPPSP